MPRFMNIYDAANKQNRLWSPSVNTFSAWYDASDSSTIGLETGVSSWSDKSANARNVSQATASRQPQYVSNGINGRPSILFDGIDDFFSTNTTSGSFITTTAYSVFVVGQVTSVSTNSATQKSNDAFFGDIVGYVSLYCKSNGNAGFWTGCNSAEAAFQINNPAIFYCEVSDGDTKLRVNGGQLVTKPGNCTSASWDMEFGRQNGNDSYNLNGMIAEMIFSKTVFSTLDRQMLEGYLSWKWGIPMTSAGNHPFVLRPPMTV